MGPGDPGVAGPVIVIDDDDDARLLLRAVLEHDGLEVVEASGGMEGIEAIAAHPDAALVILDLLMPDVAGRDVLDRAGAALRARAIPVVIRSGDLSAEGVQELRGVGASAFLSKSDPPARLLAVVRALVRRTPPGDPVVPN